MEFKIFKQWRRPTRWCCVYVRACKIYKRETARVCFFAACALEIKFFYRIYGARFMRANKSAVQIHTRECVERMPHAKQQKQASALSPDFTHPYRTRVSIGDMRNCRRSMEFGCTHRCAKITVSAAWSVDPTCASEKLLANRLINRRLDLELMQGRACQKVVAGSASLSVYIARTHNKTNIWRGRGWRIRAFMCTLASESK